ncbi:hypothetical protein M0R89_17075 [Halorussus limi]|uniref:Uncharacterized protein n=1 Tax=Halorussus limi TaxID=2938695 RepID=A0A8U0HTL5_9EURY|nr:hypothetical protein [Halorussus limi]UPV74237.1 hypothetical protein M0R89_17075 [Halorussus limi]
MTDPDLTLADVYRMLELVAFLLAVLVFQNGGTVGTVVGGGAAFLLAFDALLRFAERIGE